LHGIAVMLIVARLTAGWGHWLWVCGALAIALKYIAIFVHSSNPNLDFLDGKIFNWLGLIGQKPLTEDYVPVLPWLGVMWWGMAAGAWLLRHQPALLQALPSQRHLAGLGRWSLSFYMLHQPVLMGLLTLAGLLRR
jgi:uncharacterized membrane protein